MSLVLIKLRCTFQDGIEVFDCLSHVPCPVGILFNCCIKLFNDSTWSRIVCCRWDNSLLWDPPTESSFMGQIISSGLHHFWLFFLHTKLGKDISGTGNLDFQK